MTLDASGADREAGAVALLTVPRGRWRWVAAPVCLCAVLGFILASRKPAEYMADATLVVTGDPGLGLLGAAAAEFGIMAPGGSSIEMHKELIRSEEVVREALDELNIAMSWEDFRKFRTSGVRATSGTGTNALVLRVTRKDPDEAATITNRIVEI